MACGARCTVHGQAGTRLGPPPGACDLTSLTSRVLFSGVGTYPATCCCCCRRCCCDCCGGCCYYEYDYCEYYEYYECYEYYDDDYPPPAAAAA